LSWVIADGLVARSVTGPIERVDLVVSADRIGGDAHGARSVDASGCLVVPGHACGHHHLYSSLARGMPGPPRSPRSFLEILELVWWRLDRALDLETIHLSALLGCVEAARCGTTAVVDHHASPEAIDSSLDAVADAVAEAGVRAAVCYEVTDRHGERGGARGISENLRFARANRRALVRAMMGAHAAFTIGPATLETLVDSARAAGVPVHIHLAEDEWDQKHSVESYGARVVERLETAGALAEGDLAAHGVWLDRDEVARLRASGAWIAHNARSNMNNGVGYALAAEMGERVALGTDGIDSDMFAEARACYLRARENSLHATPDWAVERLAAGSSLVGELFAEAGLGTLAVGAPADLVVLDYQPPSPLEAGNLGAHYLFGLGPAYVRDVMVAGRWIVRERRHQLVDTDELAARCRHAAARLWSRMQEL
jgi:putative selenium metabolism protein SsnA